MNERIFELAKQAGFQYENYKDIWFLEGLNPSCNEELEKFAELIVKKCAKIANAGIDPTESYLIGNDILEHFGVEEE